MAAKVDILSKNWNDILFEGRNRSYGAYEMRALAGKRNMRALITLGILIVAVFALVLGVNKASQLIAEYQLENQANVLQNADVDDEEEDEA